MAKTGRSPTKKPAGDGASANRLASSADFGPPETLAQQVNKATLDPGYRRLAVLLDNWDAGCTCEGGSIPAPTVAAFAQSLRVLSLDPALQILAPALASLMGNCCATAITPVPGLTNAEILLLSLDPGAGRLGSAIDAMHADCCEAD